MKPYTVPPATSVNHKDEITLLCEKIAIDAQIALMEARKMKYYLSEVSKNPYNHSAIRKFYQAATYLEGLNLTYMSLNPYLSNEVY